VRRSIALVPLVLSAVAGCTAYRPVPVRRIAAGEPVRVHFTGPPRTVALARADGDSIVLRHVAELRGPVASVVGDTIRLHVWSGRDATGRELGAPPRVIATVVRGPNVSIERRVADEAATRRVAIAVLALATLAAILLYSLAHWNVT